MKIIRDMNPIQAELPIATPEQLFNPWYPDDDISASFPSSQSIIHSSQGMVSILHWAENTDLSFYSVYVAKLKNGTLSLHCIRI